MRETGFVNKKLINVKIGVALAYEPAGNLDAENEGTVLDIFRQLHSEGRTIIMVTHNPEMGENAERIIRMHHGRVEENVVCKQSNFSAYKQ